MNDDYEIFYFLILFFFAILVVASASFLIYQPEYTGKIVATGGNVMRADITGPLTPFAWMGMYGNLTSNVSASSNTTFLPGGMSYIEVPGDANTTQILIAQTPSLNQANISPATHADINAFINLSPAHAMSSNNTFTRTINFTVYNVTYSLLALKTNSYLGDYYTGALKEDNGLFFVTNIYDGLGWANKSMDFQALLPVPPSGNITYYFYAENSTPFVIPNGTNTTNGTFSCNFSFPVVSHYNTTDDTIVIDWPDVVGATSYEIDILNNTEHLNFSKGRTIVAAGSRYVDSSLDFTRRFYQVNAVDGGTRCPSTGPIGASNQSLTYSIDSPYNLISFPFNYQNSSIVSVLGSIDGEYTRLYEFNNSIKSYNTFIYGVYDAIYDIQAGKGYWIEITNNLSLVTTGVVDQDLFEDVTTPYNLLGFIAISGNRSVTSMLSSIDGNYTRVYEFNNSIKSYNTFIYGVYDAVHTLQPDFGYWVEMSDNDTLVIP
jgi:hypothetical protein